MKLGFIANFTFTLHLTKTNAEIDEIAENCDNEEGRNGDVKSETKIKTSLNCINSCEDQISFRW